MESGWQFRVQCACVQIDGRVTLSGGLLALDHRRHLASWPPWNEKKATSEETAQTVTSKHLRTTNNNSSQPSWNSTEPRWQSAWVLGSLSHSWPPWKPFRIYIWAMWVKICSFRFHVICEFVWKQPWTLNTNKHKHKQNGNIFMAVKSKYSGLFQGLDSLKSKLEKRKYRYGCYTNIWDV